MKNGEGGHERTREHAGGPTVSAIPMSPDAARTGLRTFHRHRHINRVSRRNRRYGAEPISCGEGRVGNFAPRRKSALTRGVAPGGCCVFWIRDVEEVGDLIVDGQEPLRLGPRLETLHDPFSSPCRLMRILGSIVQAFVLAMLNLKAHLRPRRAVGFKLVGNHDARRSARAFQKFRQETLRGVAISPLLDQNVENEAVLIVAVRAMMMSQTPARSLPSGHRTIHISFPTLVGERRSKGVGWNNLYSPRQPSDADFETGAGPRQENRAAAGHSRREKFDGWPVRMAATLSGDDRVESDVPRQLQHLPART
jgi:hypothetical protein